MSRKTRQYENKFKEQVVMLHKNGKSLRKISEEYGLPISTIFGWVKLYEKGGNFRISDGLSEAEKENIRLKKENKQLRMEVDILKHAALIMSRK
jgi:transposase